MDPHIPQRHWRLGGRTVHSFFLLLFLSLFSSLFLRLSLALLSSAMATQEMNADKENPDGRKMEEVEGGLNLQRSTRADLVRLCETGGVVKCRVAGLLVAPNRKIYSSSDVYLSPRQRTQRPWNDLSLMLLLHRLVSATLHSQLQQRMLGGQASSIYSQQDSSQSWNFQGNHRMLGVRIPGRESQGKLLTAEGVFLFHTEYTVCPRIRSSLNPFLWKWNMKWIPWNINPRFTLLVQICIQVQLILLSICS